MYMYKLYILFNIVLFFHIPLEDYDDSKLLVPDNYWFVIYTHQNINKIGDYRLL